MKQTDIHVTHVGVALVSCMLAGLASWTLGLPTMYKDVHTFVHCSAAIATLHAIVAAYGRIERIQSRSHVYYYILMNASTWLLVSIQHVLPHDAFIMLSKNGMSHLSLCGWALAVGLFLLIVNVISHNLITMRKLPHLHRNMPVVSAVLLAYTAIAATDSAFHVHHYMWASVLALLCQCDTKLSVSCQAIALGIANQELAFGDMQPFFD